MIISCSGINKVYIYKLNETNNTWYELSILASTTVALWPWPVDITDGYAILGDWTNSDKGAGAGSSYICSNI